MGEKAERIAIEVKGLETPGYDPRSSPGLGLAYATADRGGCHTRAWPTSYEIAGKTPDGAIIDRFSTEKRASIVKVQQDYSAAVDCLVGCWFVRGVIGKEQYVKMLDVATGIKMTVEEFLQLGERVWNLVRMFNLREGFTRKDDTLPWRFLNEPLPSGVAKGRHLTREQLKTMLDEYYMLRGWNRATGTPTKEKLKELGLNFVLPI
jgi:aldehyde:ferredoxin oxidoreductase